MGYLANMYWSSTKASALGGGVAFGMLPGVAGAIALGAFAHSEEAAVVGAVLAGGPAAVAGGAIGATILAPMWFLFNALTRHQVCHTDVDKILLKDLVDSLDYMGNGELETLFNNIYYVYKQQSRMTSNSSREVINEFESVSHIMQKREVLKAYLLRMQGGAFYNDGKLLFRIAVTQLKQSVDQIAGLKQREKLEYNPEAQENKVKCPLAKGEYYRKGKDRAYRLTSETRKDMREFVLDPVLVKYKDKSGLVQEVVVDSKNLKIMQEKVIKGNERQQEVQRAKSYIKVSQGEQQQRVTFKELEHTEDATVNLRLQSICKIVGNAFSPIARAIRSSISSLFTYSAAAQYRAEEVSQEFPQGPPPAYNGAPLFQQVAPPRYREHPEPTAPLVSAVTTTADEDMDRLPEYKMVCA
jgi:hypothetical protein